MADVVLFHHAQGLTDGVRAFAEELGPVHTPDLYDGNTFAELADGLAYLQTLGFEEIVRRGADAAVDGAVYIGMSLGAIPVHHLAQGGGARGAVMLHAFIPPLDAVPAQVHLAEDDPEVAEDLAAAREWDAGELFLYPGSAHLFTDRSLPDYDEQAAAQVLERVRAFLERM